MMILKNALAGLSVICVAEFPKLHPVKRKLTFSQYSNKDSVRHLLGLQLWNMSKYNGLAEVVRQNDKTLYQIYLLSWSW